MVEALLARGYAVHVVDDLSTGRRSNLDSVAAHPLLRLTVASVADADVARAVCADTDVVFHLAGVVGVQRLRDEPLFVMQANLQSTEAMLAAAAAARVPTLVTSSSEVYGDARVPFCEADPLRPGSTEGLRGGYACAKAMGEWLALAHAAQSGVPTIVARLFNTVGPRQSGDHGMVLPRFVRQAVRGEALTVYGGGRQTRCFAHVRDVARALVDLAESPCVPAAVVNVGSRQETAVVELARMVQRAAASGSPLQHVPFDAVFPAGFVDPPRRLPSLERLHQAIGWVPSTPVQEIVAELVSAARAPGPVGAAARAAASSS
ncbi:MAG: NAD-dependent epimerase/dehydratase family protein [Planctomycetes bacterium]|nr:NAD-dependent epimerase/dehydratase family protein [Planctomycetota bacterium]